MSAMRSLTPSPSSSLPAGGGCGRARRARSLACSRSRRRSLFAGSRSASSSACSDRVSCSPTERRSCRIERTVSPSVRRTTRCSCSYSAGKPDSARSSSSERCTASCSSGLATGHDRDVEARPGQVRPVQLGDLPPVLVDVGLREHRDDHRAQHRALTEEGQLGGGVLLRGVGHDERPRRPWAAGRGRSARVAGETPPTPGVSTSSRPPESTCRGSSTSTRASRRAAARVRGPPRPPPAPSRRGPGPAAGRTSGRRRPSRRPTGRRTRGTRRRRRRAGRPWGRRSARWSRARPPTEQTGAATRALTSRLLPLPGSPTTSTRTLGCRARSAARTRRRCRSGRPQSAASSAAWSSSSTGGATVPPRDVVGDVRPGIPPVTDRSGQGSGPDPFADRGRAPCGVRSVWTDPEVSRRCSASHAPLSSMMVTLPSVGCRRSSSMLDVTSMLGLDLPSLLSMSPVLTRSRTAGVVDVTTVGVGVRSTPEPPIALPTPPSTSASSVESGYAVAADAGLVERVLRLVLEVALDLGVLAEELMPPGSATVDLRRRCRTCRRCALVVLLWVV